MKPETKRERENLTKKIKRRAAEVAAEVEAEEKYASVPYFPSRFQTATPMQLRDPAFRAERANQATILKAHDEGANSIATAFEEFGLDACDPQHWRYLLRELAQIIYPERRTSGRPQVSTLVERTKIIDDIEKLRMQYPDESTWHICMELIGRRYNSKEIRRKATNLYNKYNRAIAR